MLSLIGTGFISEKNMNDAKKYFKQKLIYINTLNTLCSINIFIII